MNERFGEKVKAIFDSITVLQAKDSDLKRDNANINGDSPMGAMLQYGANTAKEYNLEYLIKPAIAELHRDGWIHIHDLDFYAWTTTCTQIELRKLFKNGFNIVPTMEELLVQHCIVNAMKPMFCKGMYEHSYASLPGRGAHKGKLVIEKWIRIDPKNCKYVLKMDIRHFFDSIPHDRLKAKLKKTVHDEKMLELLFRIIDVTEVGIPLGFYTSQWLSNWYLQGLDHFIKEQLCAVHYMRYMDDMVIFGSNKRVLHRMRQAISDYLEMELGLELKANWQVFRFSYGNNQGRDLDFMGFRFYRNRTILRKSIMYKATRKARKISKKEKATILNARQMLSYLGWIDCTDTYLMYRKWIKPCVSFQQLKRKVSRYDKYDEKRVYQKLVSLYTAKGGKSHGVKLQICREHSPTDCT